MEFHRYAKSPGGRFITQGPRFSHVPKAQCVGPLNSWCLHGSKEVTTRVTRDGSPVNVILVNNFYLIFENI